MNDSGKIFVACASGGGMGTLLALQMNLTFWWIGLIVGGALGYVSFDPMAIVHAIPEAWVTTKRCSRKAAEAFFFGAREGFCLTSTVIFPVYILCVKAVGGTNVFVYMFLVGFMVFMSLFMGVVAGTEYLSNPGLLTKKRVRADWKHCNALAVYGYYLPMGIWHLLNRVPRMISAIPGVALKAAVVLHDVVASILEFGWNLFKLVHSELRVLCMVDAAIGTAIGYRFGSPLVGAVTGGIFGVLNYEVVSVRWLKLLPAKKPV